MSKKDSGQNENEELYRLIIETAIDVVYTTNPEGYFTYVNPRGEQMTGYTAEELIGMHYTNLLEDKWRIQVEEFYKKQFEEYLYETTFVVPIVVKSGQQKWVEQTVRLVSDGKWISGYHGIARDVTERKSAEDRLRQSELEYRNLFENAHDAIVIIAPENEVVLDVNQRGCEVYGFKKSEFVGMPMTEISENKTRGEAAIKATVKGRRYSFESVHLRKDGSKMYLEINAAVINYKGREAILSINRDVTDRKMIQREKEMLQAQVLQSQKMEAIGNLAGGVAHDFTNMLTVINGHADLMMAKIDEANPMYRDLKQIIVASGRASELTRKLLLFSRKERMELNPLNLNQLTTDLLKMLKRLIGEDIRIETSLHADLHTVKADPGNMEQVIMNLTVNARDAMPEGGVIKISTQNVEVSAQDARLVEGARAGRFVSLSVQDQGSGIEEEIIRHIFEPFFSTKDPGKGSGLGLSVVYGIINQHDGWVEVQSSPGDGAIFKVFLPAFAEKIKERKERVVIDDSLSGNRDGVLVVEDDDVVRDVVERTLLEYNYTVFTATTTNEAMRLFDKNRKDIKVLFSDVVLPDGNGISLAEKIMTLDNSIKVIFCSGYMDDKSKWPLIQQKGFRFFNKPYAIRDLLIGLKRELQN